MQKPSNGRRAFAEFGRRLAFLGLILGVVALMVLPMPGAAAIPSGRSVSSVSPVLPRSASSVWVNYTTAHSLDIRQVATDANGRFVVATTGADQLLVFTTPYTSPLAPIMNITLTENVTSVALADSGPVTGTAVMLVALGPGIEAFNLTVGTNAPFWSYSYFGIPKGDTKFVREVALSLNGEVAAAVAGYSNNNTGPGFNFTYFQGASVGGVGTYSVVSGYKSTNGFPLDMELDDAGARAVVGVACNFGAGACAYLFNEGQFEGQWSASSENGSLTATALSGDGNWVFISTNSVTLVAATPTIINTVTGFQAGAIYAARGGGGPLLQVNYTGANILLASGPTVSFFNTTEQGGFNPPAGLSPSWGGKYGDFVDNITLASTPGYSSYFAVAEGKLVNWYYYYDGIDVAQSAAYDTTGMAGDVTDLAMDSTGAVLAIGGAWSGTQGDELSIIDAPNGIPTPAAPILTLEAQSPSVGDSSASVLVSWTEPSSPGITSFTLRTNLETAGSGNVPPEQIVQPTSANTYSEMVTGLSFSTNYSFTVCAIAFNGARQACTTGPGSAAGSSAGQPFLQTPAALPPTDPAFFYSLDYVAIAFLVAGVVAYVVLSVVPGSKSKKALAASPPPASPYSPPPQGPS